MAREAIYKLMLIVATTKEVDSGKGDMAMNALKQSQSL